MKVVEDNTITGIYKKLLSLILENGIEVSPRGLMTKEIHPACAVLTLPCNNIVISEARAINPLFMIDEFAWIFNNMNDVEYISRFNKAMKNFSDDGITMHGAYGRRLYDYNGTNQIEEAFKKLNENKDTRQAVLLIFDPSKDYKPTKDVPCNNLLKFTVRNNQLDLSVYVRSQDMILGFPYDVYHWTSFQQLMATILNLKIGYYYHIMDSAHIYQKDLNLAREITDEECNDICSNDIPIIDYRNVINTPYSITAFAQCLLIAGIDFHSSIEMMKNGMCEYIKLIAGMYHHHYKIDMCESCDSSNNLFITLYHYYLKKRRTRKS